jgi:uncharacterized membrane protein
MAADSSGRVSASLAAIPLFAEIDEAGLEALALAMREEKVEAQKTVFWTADRGDCMYVVVSGEVTVSVPDEKGEEVVLDHVGPGGFFGEISLLDGEPRTATVRATEATGLLRLDRSDFHSFLLSRPEAAIRVLTVMGKRQRASTWALRHRPHPNVEFERGLTLWQRASDVIARVAASATFTVFHVAWFGGWISINTLAALGALPSNLEFDPFPFGLLTMVVSLEAIFLSIFVMVSQNRQAERDRLRVDLDYQVNLKAETEITDLARRIERLETHILGARDEPDAPSPTKD